MGVRLYPIAKPEIIERIVGVPAGTSDRLERFWEETREDYNDIDKSYDVWEKLQQDKDLAALDTFQTFGWGKLTGGTIRTIRCFAPNPAPKDWEWCGSVTDLEAIENIVEEQLASKGLGILHEDLVCAIESLHWG